MNLAGLLSASNGLPGLPRLLDLLDGARRAGRPVARLAIVDPAKPYLIAALQSKVERPLLVVVAQAARARSVAEQIQAFAARPDLVALFPEHDSLFYERLLADSPLIQQRLSALALLSGDATGNSPAVVVASVRALMHRVLPPEGFSQAVKTVRIGQVIRPDDLVAQWVALGYSPAPLVEDPGTFSRRGGIVDVYPVGWPTPARVEFFGDEVDSIRLFDPTTQRSKERIEAVQVLPAHEILPPAGLPSALRAVDVSALRTDAASRWQRDLDRLEGGESFEGIELYSPYLPSASAAEYLPASGLVVLDEPSQIRAAAEGLVKQAQELRAQLIERGELPASFAVPYLGWEELAERLLDRTGLELSWHSEPTPDLVGLADSFHPVYPYGGRLKLALDDAQAAVAAGSTVVLVTRQSRRIQDFLGERGVDVAIATDASDELSTLAAGRAAGARGAIVLVNGSLTEGFAVGGPPEGTPPAATASPKTGAAEASSPPVGADSGRSVLRVLTDREIFGWSKPTRTIRPRPAARQAFLADLEEGGYVVHVEHGVARYLGIRRMPSDGVERDYLMLEYAAGDRLYVPTDQADRVGRYVGPGDAAPTLSRLGTSDWVRAKSRVRAAVQQMAEELLELYAARSAKAGHAFAPDNTWQAEMENSFPYIETADQLEAIQMVKADMERARPMDRLLCGDVGYGKTEVALRAAFKAAMDGKQVAVLVPTTVLAQQHYNTFRERLQAFPVRVEMLSRFRSEKEQAKAIAELKAGIVDICIGTHRLIQKDVEFKDLGLVIVDEEQRFGVGHKERLKQLRREVDVLTLSATPIPRTLHMALVGVRDMSTMDTAPEDRLPIKTYVAEYDESLIRDAILREIDRGGQIYFVHNRVQTIYGMASRLAELVPEASIAVGHGQLPEDALENVMIEFSNGLFDVLVCSTIIESGLDIPNVNTIIVNRSDMFGLAQLYQLRGRVGRGANRAYSYFLYPKGRQLSEIAETRLRAIFEATELGSGFRIAMKDLEIRGAGNLLGPEQHGNVATVGFHLYCQLLAEAVKRLKGEEVKTPISVTIDLPLSANLPSDYVEDESARLSLYQRLAAVRDLDDLGAISLELADRFGAPPQPALDLLYLVQLKCLAARAKIESIGLEGADRSGAAPGAAPGAAGSGGSTAPSGPFAGAGPLTGDVMIQLGSGARVDRAKLVGQFGDRLRFGATQIRFARQPKPASPPIARGRSREIVRPAARSAPEPGWQDYLLRVVEALAEPATTPAGQIAAQPVAQVLRPTGPRRAG